MVADAAAMLEVLVLAQAALWREGDLLPMERQVQRVPRQAGSVLVSGVLGARARSQCGGQAGALLLKGPRGLWLLIKHALQVGDTSPAGFTL